MCAFGHVDRRQRTADRATCAGRKPVNQRSPVRAPSTVSGRRSDRPAPLTCPYPDYVTCPVCGELEVEVWCYAEGVRCHACGSHIPHDRAGCYRSKVCTAPGPKATS